ncbi:hypothetical protein [Nostoc sp.]
MPNYSNSKHEQSSLNINQLESLLADGLFTQKVQELIRMLTNEQVSTKDIRKQAEKGRLQLRYSYGVLRVIPSHKGKSGRCWRWDVIFSPVSWMQVSD